MNFKIQIANRFEKKKIENEKLVGIEPIIDGIRCIAILKDNDIKFYSSKKIEIKENLTKLIKEDFESLLKEKKIEDYCIFDGVLSKIGNCYYYFIFDWMPWSQWEAEKPEFTCQEVREKLEDMLFVTSKFIKLVVRDIVPPSNIMLMHKAYTSKKYKGTIVKILNAKYNFGKTYNIMEIKDFYNIDLEITSFEEGCGKYNKMLGAIIAKYGSSFVKIDSGFSIEERKEIWENRTKFRNKFANIKYKQSNNEVLIEPSFNFWKESKK